MGTCTRFEIQHIECTIQIFQFACTKMYDDNYMEKITNKFINYEFLIYSLRFNFSNFKVKYLQHNTADIYIDCMS